MHHIKPRRPTPALIVATAALFMALGGGAYAVPNLASSAPKPTVVRATMHVAPSSSHSKYAHCPSGSFATGGGAGMRTGADSTLTYVKDSGPVDKSGNFSHTGTGTRAVSWYVTVENDNTFPITYYVWAICEHP